MKEGKSFMKINKSVIACAIAICLSFIWWQKAAANEIGVSEIVASEAEAGGNGSETSTSDKNVHTDP